MKPNRGLNAATKRWGTLSRPQLEEFVQKLKRVTQNIEGMCDAFPSIHPIQIDGATKGMRAMELLESYAVVVNEAVTN